MKGASILDRRSFVASFPHFPPLHHYHLIIIFRMTLFQSSIVPFDLTQQPLVEGLSRKIILIIISTMLFPFPSPPPEPHRHPYFVGFSFSSSFHLSSSASLISLVTSHNDGCSEIIMRYHVDYHHQHLADFCEFLQFCNFLTFSEHCCCTIAFLSFLGWKEKR